MFAFGGSLLMGIAGVAHADATPFDSDLRTELEAVKAQLAELKAAQDDQWLDQRRAEEVKTLIRDVLADADTRASLLENGMTAGHNGSRFFLASDNGGFLMEIGGMIQMRYIYSNQDRTPETDPDDDEIVVTTVDDENEFGFEIARAKIRFDGHIADPRFQYRVQLIADPGNNTASWDEIVISYEWSDGVTLWIGEDKAPFLREEMTLPQHLLAVDRSYMNEVFTMGVVQGVGVVIDGDTVMDVPIMAHVMINDGYWSGDGATAVNPLTQSGSSQIPVDEDGLPLVDDDDFTLNFGSSSSGKNFDRDRSDFAITARIDAKLAGDWGDMADYSSWGDETAAFVGAAIHWEIGETGDSAFNNNFLTWTVDGSVECHGWGLAAAIVGHHTDLEHPNQVLAQDSDLYGYLVQGSYMIPNSSVEPFVRWEHLDFDNSLSDVFGNSYDDVDLLTFGANCYFNGHAAKATLDLVWALDALPLSSSQLGLQADDPHGEDQIVLRAQLQLVF
jgi:hypothetical protein